MNAAFNRRRSRIGVLTLVLAAFFLLAAVRLIALVVLDGPRLTSLAKSEHTAQVELVAIRGPIVDRHGEPFALSAETRSVFARPRRLLEASTSAQRLALAQALGIAPQELQARLAHPAPFVWLARRISRERAEAAETLGLEGVGALSEYKRFYPESNLAASVVGLAGVDSQGLSGLELQYDRRLRGEPMVLRVDRDALGRQILDSPLALRGPQPGAALDLTIDAEVQALAETELGNQVRASGARRGSAIVLDPFSGEVLALASVSAEREGAHDRLHNSAVQDAFEPGSTVKGILGAIALEDHAIGLDQKIYCEDGQWTVGGRRIHDHSSHQWLDLGGIIEVSSNIGAAKVALRLGAERYYRGLAAFGLGRRTGIDLPGEAAGLLRKPSGWTAIDLANHGFGQGIAVTALQLAVAYCAIANGGLVMRPFVVRAAYDPQGREIMRHTPQVLGRAVAPAVAHAMNLVLRSVVNGEDGTGRRARVEDFMVAGKTGTAQMVNPQTGAYYRSRLVSSFVGFVPADDPRLVILVVLEDVSHGHFGGLFAAPVFSSIAAGTLGRLNVASSRRAYETASLLPVTMLGGAGGHPEAGPAAEPDHAVREPARAASAMPDFIGSSLRGALGLAHRAGLNLEVEGSGYVISQTPAAGEPLSATTVKLALAAGQDGAPPATARAARAPGRGARERKKLR